MCREFSTLPLPRVAGGLIGAERVGGGAGSFIDYMKMFNFALKTVIEAFVTMMIALWMRLVNSIQLQLCVCGDPISFLLSLAPRWL